MKPLDFNASISVESYDEKTAENYRNCYVAYNLSQIPQDLNDDCVKISRLYLLYYPRNKPSNSVTPVHSFKIFR